MTDVLLLERMTVDVICYLEDCPKQFLSQISSDLHIPPKTLDPRVQELIYQGFVESMTATGYAKKVYTLTPKGIRLAYLIHMIRDLGADL